MKNIILLCGFIMTMFLCTSCQYKYPVPWYSKMFTANWRHELKPKLCKCDDKKLIFIDEFIKNYPDLDSTFFETECYSMNDYAKRWLKRRKASNEKSTSIELLKDGYEISCNVKHFDYYEGKKCILHIISIIPTDGRGIVSIRDPIKNHGCGFYWYYNEQEDKWILDDIID